MSNDGSVPPFGSDDLCHPVSRRMPFTADGWLFELKHDGFRALARKTAMGIQLLSRSGRSLATAFPETMVALAALPDVVLDGELVIPDAEGRSSFAELRRRFLLQEPRQRGAITTATVLVVFDVLYVDGADVRSLPLAERRERLCEQVEPSRGLHVIQALRTYGEAFFATIVEQDHEGIVAKRVDAPYRSGRQSSWVKIKNRSYSRREAVEGRGR